MRHKHGKQLNKTEDKRGNKNLENEGNNSRNLEKSVWSSTPRILLIAVAHSQPDPDKLYDDMYDMSGCGASMEVESYKWMHWFADLNMNWQERGCFLSLLQITYLGEAEEQSNATAELKGIVDGLLQLVETGLTDHTSGDSRGVDLIGRATGFLKEKISVSITVTWFKSRFSSSFTHITRNIRVPGRIESAALERVLHLFLHVNRTVVPSPGSQLLLLVLVDSQTGTGHWKLDQEEDKQNNHVLQGGGRRRDWQLGQRLRKIELEFKWHVRVSIPSMGCLQKKDTKNSITWWCRTAPARPRRDVISRITPHARIPDTMGNVTMEAARA